MLCDAAAALTLENIVFLSQLHKHSLMAINELLIKVSYKVELPLNLNSCPHILCANTDDFQYCYQ